MQILRVTSCVFAVVVIAVSSVGAAELLPSGKPIEAAVDHYIDAKLKEASVAPAAAADDANFIRRVTLDLVGRIPTVSETRAFVASTAPDKRVQLVDRLLASPGFVRHQAAEFDTMLMAGQRGKSMRDYLLRAFAENRPWDQIYKEVLLADESDAKTKGSGEFVRERLKDVDRLTNDVSVIFFGVNVSCAKCHDHPKVPDWKQDHFYGMKSFFVRTIDNGGFLAEREFGLVKFKTASGQDRQARMMFLTGKVIDTATVKEPTKEEEKQEKEKLEEFKKKKQPPPPPKFSARAQFVELTLQPGQREFLSRAIVNRVWHRFLGHGLVMPLDQMHSENPPSHPELLTWLARDLEEHAYDLKRLTRGLVLSKAYARSSRWDAGDPPRPNTFALAQLRALTPLQLAASLRLATTDPTAFPADQKPEELEKRIEAQENIGRGMASLFEQPRENFQISVSEALLFSNGDRFQKELLSDTGDRLVARLKQIDNVRDLVDTMVRSVLCRAATEEEHKAFTAYLAARTERKAEACRQLVWVLLTSPEFRFNY